MPTIWFIRHTESETDAGLPASNTLQVPLTYKGREQAQRIAHVFTTYPDLIITSPYARSQQTAVPTVQRFPDARQEIWPVHEFTYLAQSPGPKPTTLEDRRSRVNSYWSRQDPYYRDGEETESFADFMNRAGQVLEQLKNREEEFIVIFTHGQFILSVLSWLMGLIYDMPQFRHFLLANRIPNGAILKVHLQQTQRISFSPFSTSHLPAMVEATIT